MVTSENLPNEGSTVSIALIDDGLFASTDPVALRGSSCVACGINVFPAQGSCPTCTAVDVNEVVLPTEGSVWSWTTQHFAPKAPFRTDVFVPFSIGYVDLGPLIVEGWLLNKTEWQMGEAVRLELAKAWTDDDGTIVYTYGFAATS